MTPPFRIHNFTTGSVYPQPLTGSADGDVLLRPARDGARSRGETESEIARASGRSYFLFDQATRYGREEILPRFEADAVADMDVGMGEWLDEARRGQRRMYFETLRLGYALLARSPEEHRADVVGRILSVAQEYDQSLGRSSLSPAEKFRYLFAASRVLQATLAFVHDHPIAVDPGTETFEAEIRQELRRLDAHLTEFYAEIGNPGDSTPGARGIFQLIQLREAALDQNVEAERMWALALEAFLAESPPEAQAGDWTAMHLRSMLGDPNFLDNLVLADQASAAEREGLALGALALDLAIAAGWTLDAVQEEEEAALRERYQSLALVMTALLRIQPEYGMEENLAFLADPRALDGNLSLLQQSAQQYPEIQEILSTAGAEADWPTLLERAQEAASHLIQLRTGPGRAVLEPIFRLSREAHPICRLADALEGSPPWIRDLALPSSGLSFYFARAGQAIELYRRGGEAIRTLENRGEAPSDFGVGEVLALLRTQGSSAGIQEFLQSYFEEAQILFESGEDHELAALQAVLQIIEENREAYARIGIRPESLRHATLLRARMEAWDFRGRQTLRHLFSSSNLLGIGAGILMSEIFPTLMILRAGAGGRLTLRGMGGLVNAGRLTLRGEILSGLTTGMGMSGVGSLLHNAERERLGLPTHTSRDALQGGLLNAVVFGATLPFSRALGNSLAWNNWRRRGVFEAGGLRRFFHHAGTVAFAGTASLGLGVLLRGAETGELYTTPEEMIENFGTILMWEAGASGLRWARRRVGIPREISGWHRATDTPAIPGAGRGPLARAGRIGGRAWRELQRALVTTVGPYRIGWAQDLTGRLIESNPGLRGSESRVTEALIRQESRDPGTLAHFEAQTRLGTRPAWLGSSRAQRLVMLRGEHLPRESEVPARRTLGRSPEPETVSRPASPEGETATASKDPDAASPAQLVAPHPTDPIARSFYFAVAEPGPGGESGILHLPPADTGPEGERIYTIQRAHFEFLSESVRRIISRRHFQMILDTQGNWRVRDLSRSPRHQGGLEAPPSIPIAENFGTFLHVKNRSGQGTQHALLNPDEPMAIEPGMSLSLGQPGESVELSFLRVATESGRPPSRPPSASPADTTAPHPSLASFHPEDSIPIIIRDTLPPPPRQGLAQGFLPPDWPPSITPTRLALELGRHSPLEGLRVIRDREGSLFRLLGPGGTRVAIIRPGEDGGSQIQSYEASENPILGEIGDEVGLILNPGPSERRWILALDDPQGSGTRIPQVLLGYGNATRTLRFRAGSPVLNLGRIYSEGLFTAPWISRHHIVIELAERAGHPRYRLTTQGRWGLRVNGEMLGRGDFIDLPSGEHRLEFPMREAADVFDIPVSLGLPPLEVNFPEWRMNLRAGHDRGVVAAPVERTSGPIPEDRAETALAPERPSADASGELRISFPDRPWWKKLFGIED